MKEFRRIMKELDYPPIFLIPAWQFEMLEGEEKRDKNRVGEDVLGIAAIDYPVFAVWDDVGGKTLQNVIWHEIGHHLWPWRPHWWIDLFGEVMAEGGGRGEWADLHNKTTDDIQPREKLLQMARRQAAKLKRRYKIRRTS